MTDQDIIDAILNAASDRIEACEVETDTTLRISRIYQISGDVTARYTYIPFAAYPKGIAMNAMLKEQIELIEPDERTIYKTDWIDELKSV